MVHSVGLSDTYTIFPSVTAVSNCAFVHVIPTILVWSHVLVQERLLAHTVPAIVVLPFFRTVIASLLHL